jgi:ATP-dependent HslUV protease ATP-binding subunit HslU
VPEDLRDEIAPKNIIMIGPTGVGKTEIARRLAKLAKAPFIKVEASKFTEVGYVGRDVESMVRDLVGIAINLVRQERVEDVKVRAAERAEDQLVGLLSGTTAPSRQGTTAMGPFLVTPPPGAAGVASEPQALASLEGLDADTIRARLRAGELDEERVEVDVSDASNPFMTIFGAHGMEEMELNLRDMMGNLPGMKGKTKKRSMKVGEARRVLEQQEAEKLVDMDEVQREAVRRTEESGIVFLDEIDKVSGRQSAGSGPDVSREGVQRDLLPIVEGSTVSTKYGPVKTDHVLFIAAGAFHVSNVSDLIPELQGRFPIRVELDSLTKADFVRILTEPRTALTKQYTALLATEGLDVVFEADAVEAIASYAAEANERAENIGARRLHTILEALLEELSFTAPERAERTVKIDSEYVRRTLDPIVGNRDLAKYIL